MITHTKFKIKNTMTNLKEKNERMSQVLQGHYLQGYLYLGFPWCQDIYY